MAVSDVEPIPSASVLVLRDHPMEVLMIRRHEASSFVPNVWAFPGGALEPEDGAAGDLEALARAARREAREETGIVLTGELVWTSRWITPAGMPKRFDTWFFLTQVPRDTSVTLQISEAAESTWIAPADALGRGPEVFPMVFPTIRNLQAVASFTSAGDLLQSRRGAKIEAIQPVLIVEGSRKKIVLP